MSYERLTLIKKNVYDWLYEKINESDYTIGEGVGEIRLLNSFPEINESGEYVNLVLPTVAIDFKRERSRNNEDFGVTCSYDVEFDVDVFARDFLEREYILSVCKKAIEDYSIPYKDYNSVTEVTPTIGYLRSKEVYLIPINVETPGDQEKYRGAVNFVVTLIQEY